MKNKILVATIMLSFTFFVGCNDETVNESAVPQTITADETVVNTEIDASVDDVAIIAEDQFEMQTISNGKTAAGKKSMLPNCAVVTVVSENENWKRTIDFGTQGCTMPNGNVLKGKVIITMSKKSANPVKNISYKLEGFYHNGNLVEGSKTITHEMKISDLLNVAHPVSTHSIDLKVTNSEGKIYTRTGTRIREMVEGFATVGNWEDNVFKVWGTHTTTFPDGSKHVFVSLKTNALVHKASCKMPHPVSGITEITKKEVKATLDFGNGECDNLATMTIGGVSKEIELKRKKK